MTRRARLDLIKALARAGDATERHEKLVICAEMYGHGRRLRGHQLEEDSPFWQARANTLASVAPLILGCNEVANFETPSVSDDDATTNFADPSVAQRVNSATVPEVVFDQEQTVALTRMLYHTNMWPLVIKAQLDDVVVRGALMRSVRQWLAPNFRALCHLLKRQGHFSTRRWRQIVDRADRLFKLQLGLDRHFLDTAPELRLHPDRVIEQHRKKTSSHIDPGTQSASVYTDVGFMTGQLLDGSPGLYEPFLSESPTVYCILLADAADDHKSAEFKTHHHTTYMVKVCCAFPEVGKWTEGTTATFLVTSTNDNEPLTRPHIESRRSDGGEAPIHFLNRAFAEPQAVLSESFPEASMKLIGIELDGKKLYQELKLTVGFNHNLCVAAFCAVSREVLFMRRKYVAVITWDHECLKLWHDRVPPLVRAPVLSVLRGPLGSFPSLVASLQIMKKRIGRTELPSLAAPPSLFSHADWHSTATSFKFTMCTLARAAAAIAGDGLRRFEASIRDATKFKAMSFKPEGRGRLRLSRLKGGNAVKLCLDPFALCTPESPWPSSIAALLRVLLHVNQSARRIQLELGDLSIEDARAYAPFFGPLMDAVTGLIEIILSRHSVSAIMVIAADVKPGQLRYRHDLGLHPCSFNELDVESQHIPMREAAKIQKCSFGDSTGTRNLSHVKKMQEEVVAENDDQRKSRQHDAKYRQRRFRREKAKRLPFQSLTLPTMTAEVGKLGPDFTISPAPIVDRHGEPSPKRTASRAAPSDIDANEAVRLSACDDDENDDDGDDDDGIIDDLCSDHENSDTEEEEEEEEADDDDDGSGSSDSDSGDGDGETKNPAGDHSSTTLREFVSKRSVAKFDIARVEMRTKKTSIVISDRATRAGSSATASGSYSLRGEIQPSRGGFALYITDSTKLDKTPPDPAAETRLFYHTTVVWAQHCEEGASLRSGVVVVSLWLCAPPEFGRRNFTETSKLFKGFPDDLSPFMSISSVAPLLQISIAPDIYSETWVGELLSQSQLMREVVPGRWKAEFLTFQGEMMINPTNHDTNKSLLYRKYAARLVEASTDDEALAKMWGECRALMTCVFGHIAWIYGSSVSAGGHGVVNCAPWCKSCPVCLARLRRTRDYGDFETAGGASDEDGAVGGAAAVSGGGGGTPITAAGVLHNTCLIRPGAMPMAYEAEGLALKEQWEI